MRVKAGNKKFPFVREVDFRELSGDVTSENGVLEVYGALTSDGSVAKVVKLTQAEYDALDPVVATTVYIIEG